MTLPTPPGPIPPPMPPRRQVPPGRVAMIVILSVVVATIGTVGVIALTGGFSGSSTFTLHGSITLIPSPDVADVSWGDGCQGENGYSDLTPGAAVLVADPQGHTVGTGQLQLGIKSQDVAGNTCVMPFTVPNVPLDLSSYSVTISHRGTQVESPSEAHAGVELTIGSRS